MTTATLESLTETVGTLEKQFEEYMKGQNESRDQLWKRTEKTIQWMVVEVRKSNKELEGKLIGRMDNLKGRMDNLDTKMDNMDKHLTRGLHFTQWLMIVCFSILTLFMVYGTNLINLK